MLIAIGARQTFRSNVAPRALYFFSRRRASEVVATRRG
jgi:hypothetical protein